MDRVNLEIKRVENTTNRQVTYSKRRNGLIKKAYELLILCDIDIALIMLTHGVQRREHLLSSHLSSYEASTMQQSIAGPFVNGVAEGWLPENGQNQAHLFDASFHSNQLRELSSTIYESLLERSSSSSNQNNMSECHVTNHNGEMFPEWVQTYLSSSALLASMNQEGVGARYRGNDTKSAK